jgi:hypothetical protein
MLLVSRSGLVEEDATEVFHNYGFLLSSLLMQNFKLLQGNNNVTVFPFPLHIFMPLANLWSIRLLLLCSLRLVWTLLRDCFQDHNHLRFESRYCSRDYFVSSGHLP